MGLYMNQFTRLLLACLCLGIAAMGTSPAFAAKKKKAKTTASGKNPTIVFDDAWTETKSIRKQRLLRECRGQVNAGACAGLTRS
jgi:hypothetical protein